MPIKKWLAQYLLAVPALFIVLSFVQYIKGREFEYAVEFGFAWR